MNHPPSTKNIAILMATYNGISWLNEQIDSLLNQADVRVCIYISDDMSTDGSWEYLQELAASEPRIKLLSRANKFGRAAANFYRLILDTDTTGYDFVAFSDQDDIWELDKLSRQIKIATEGGYDGVSSGVLAFWADGRVAPIIKSQTQRKLDFIFESAGPGCTYLMSPWLIAEIRKILTDNSLNARDIALHDWLVYAVCRANSKNWKIDANPTLKYRQHASNEVGANHGFGAKIARLKKIKDGWYRAEIIKILEVCKLIKPCDALFSKLSDELASRGYLNGLRLLRYVGQARRKAADRLMLAIIILCALF